MADGNIWTSSGVSAGMDMTYAFVADQYGEDLAQEIANRSEYTRQKDSTIDPFAKLTAAGRLKGEEKDLGLMSGKSSPS